MNELKLPYPPSVNHYWVHRRRGTFISDIGQAFRKEVWALCYGLPKVSGPLSVVIDLHPPDRRRRDLDNVLKALLDALQHAGVYDDDSLIDSLAIHRHEAVSGGCVMVTIDSGHSPNKAAGLFNQQPIITKSIEQEQFTNEHTQIHDSATRLGGLSPGFRGPERQVWQDCKRR